MSNLPPELIADILPRLPGKSLCRFRCVSKSWGSRISDSEFVKAHLHRAQFNRLILSSANSLYSIDHENEVVAAVEIDYPKEQTQNRNPHGIQIIGSCNGLVCIMPQPDIFFIFNPATHESTRLPYALIGYGGPCAAIAYGFGYAASIDDYKLVKAAPSPAMAVFSLRLGDWETSTGFFYENLIESEKDPLPPGTLLNGALHWVFKVRGYGGKCVIAAFDLETDKFRSMPVPETAVSGFSTGVLNGRLCLMHREDGLRRGHFWVMMEYCVGDSWTRILVEEPCLVVKPLCLWKNSMILIAKDKKELVLCDPKNGTCKSFEVNGIPDTFYADVYVESLLSLPVFTEKNSKFELFCLCF